MWTRQKHHIPELKPLNLTFSLFLSRASWLFTISLWTGSEVDSNWEKSVTSGRGLSASRGRGLNPLCVVAITVSRPLERSFEYMCLCNDPQTFELHLEAPILPDKLVYDPPWLLRPNYAKGDYQTVFISFWKIYCYVWVFGIAGLLLSPKFPAAGPRCGAIRKSLGEMRIPFRRNWWEKTSKQWWELFCESHQNATKIQAKTLMSCYSVTW